MLNKSSTYRPDPVGQSTVNAKWAATVARGWSQTGELIFDIPKSRESSFPSHAVLGIANYNETVTAPASRQLGLIALAH